MILSMATGSLSECRLVRENQRRYRFLLTWRKDQNNQHIGTVKDEGKHINKQTFETTHWIEVNLLCQTSPVTILAKQN